MKREETLKAAVQAKIALDSIRLAAAHARHALNTAESEARKVFLWSSYPLTVAVGDGEFCTVTVSRESGGRIGDFTYTFSTGVAS